MSGAATIAAVITGAVNAFEEVLGSLLIPMFKLAPRTNGLLSVIQFIPTGIRGNENSPVESVEVCAPLYSSPRVKFCCGEPLLSNAYPATYLPMVLVWI